MENLKCSSNIRVCLWFWFLVKIMKHIFHLPELLKIGSEELLKPESSVFATGTLNVNPIYNEKRYFKLSKYHEITTQFYINQRVY